MNALNRLSSLNELRFKGNPLTNACSTPSPAGDQSGGTADAARPSGQMAPAPTPTPSLVSVSAARVSPRQQLIARIARLQTLNGTAIESGERRGAELDYLKAFGRRWLQLERTQTTSQSQSSSADERAQFLAEHPRFPELIQSTYYSTAFLVASLHLTSCALDAARSRHNGIFCV